MSQWVSDLLSRKRSVPTWMASTSMTNWKPVMKLIAKQGSSIICEFSSTTWIQLLLMPMLFTKRKFMQKWVYSISKSSSPNWWFPSWKHKITAEEPHLTAELPQPLKEPDNTVQFTEKRQRCQYCFTNGKTDVKCFTYCKSYNVLLRVQKGRNCFKLYHSFWEQLYNLTMCWWTSKLLDFFFFFTCFSYDKFL